MKKHLFFFSLLVLSCLTVGCQNDGEDGNVYVPDMREVTVTLSQPSTDDSGVDSELAVANTRMSVVADGFEDDWEIAWEESDKVDAWYYTIVTDGSPIAEFTVNNVYEDGERAEFSGLYDASSADSDGTLLARFIYPSGAGTTNSYGSYMIDISEQTVIADDHDHFGDNNLYMYSDSFDIVEAANSEYFPSLTMNHLMACYELAITADAADSLNVESIVIEGISSGGTIVFDDGNLTSSTSTTITLTLDTATLIKRTEGSSSSLEADKNAIIIPFSGAPSTLNDVTFTFYFNNGETYIETKSLGRYLTKAGFHYAFDIEIETSKVGYYLADVTAETILDEGMEYEFLDEEAVTADFDGLNDALSRNGVSVKLSFPNLKTLPKNALSNRAYVTSVSMPMLETIGEAAFQNSTSIKSFTLGTEGNGISSIGGNVFDGFEEYTSVTIGEETYYCKKDNLASAVVLSIKLATDSNCSISGKVLTVDDGTTYTFYSIGE